MRGPDPRTHGQAEHRPPSNCHAPARPAQPGAGRAPAALQLSCAGSTGAARGRQSTGRRLDCRVKPGNDNGGGAFSHVKRPRVAAAGKPDTTGLDPSVTRTGSTGLDPNLIRTESTGLGLGVARTARVGSSVGRPVELSAVWSGERVATIKGDAQPPSSCAGSTAQPWAVQSTGRRLDCRVRPGNDDVEWTLVRSSEPGSEMATAASVMRGLDPRSHGQAEHRRSAGLPGQPTAVRLADAVERARATRDHTLSCAGLTRASMGQAGPRPMAGSPGRARR